jgi:hypothetical protein
VPAGNQHDLEVFLSRVWTNSGRVFPILDALVARQYACETNVFDLMLWILIFTGDSALKSNALVKHLIISFILAGTFVI